MTPDPSSPIVVENPWERLNAFTDARIGLGRAGVSLPTSKLLAFQLAHAQAQDAVHCPLDVEALSTELTQALNLSEAPLRLHSHVPCPCSGPTMADALTTRAVSTCSKPPRPSSAMTLRLSWSMGFPRWPCSKTARHFLARFIRC
mgnify:CR=1 FL=1